MVSNRELEQVVEQVNSAFKLLEEELEAVKARLSKLETPKKTTTTTKA